MIFEGLKMDRFEEIKRRSQVVAGGARPTITYDDFDWLMRVAGRAKTVVHRYGELCPCTGSCISDHYTAKTCDCGYQKLKACFQLTKE